MNLQIMKIFLKKCMLEKVKGLEEDIFISENDASLSSDFERILFKRTQWQ